MVFRKTLCIVMISGALVVGIPQFSHAVSASAVTLNFMCPCGTCDEALSTCECPQSDGYRSQIAGMVGQGYTEEQIIQDFKGRYGPDVLIANAAMAPNATGQLLSKRTFGFLLLLASVSLVAFSLGKYAKSAPSSARGNRRSTPRARSAGSPAKKSRSRVEDHHESGKKRYLEDHEL